MRCVEVDLRFGGTLKSAVAPAHLDVAVDLDGLSGSSLSDRRRPGHHRLPSRFGFDDEPT